MNIEEMKKDLEQAKANAYRWDGVCNYLLGKILAEEKVEVAPKPNEEVK